MPNCPLPRLLAATIALAFAAPAALAASFTYEGRLDDLGQPANGRYDLKLSAYGDAGHGTTLAAPITFEGVEVIDGRFRLDVELPQVKADQVWLEVAVRGSGEPSFSAIPGRTKAIAAPLVGACWSTTGDTGVNPATNFLGTIDNQPFVIRTRNAQSLRIEPSSDLFGGLPITTNTMAGSSANTVTLGVRGATISGGGVPTGADDPNFFDENPNRVTDHYGSVGGGYANRAGDNAGTTIDRPFATVGGGQNNTASGNASTVGGGSFITASGIFSTVGGGQTNTASGGSSTVGGGSNNTASGGISTVGGGARNNASGLASTVGGGDGSTASGTGSTVGGGVENCAGGETSWAGGRSAKVRPGINPGGSGPCSGLSYPGGTGDAGTFVWADNQSANFVSTGVNQFLVRAQGGMAINTNVPTAGAALTVNGNVDVASPGSLSFGSLTRQMLNLWGPANYGIGVQSDRLYFRSSSGFSWFQGGVHDNAADNAGTGGTLRMRLSDTGQLQTTTGTISTLSDARLKDQVSDYVGALDRINALRPVTYHYRDAGKAAFQPEGTHLGFVAQEMLEVFPQWVSEGDDGHLMLSMRGFEAVAVRAMQELSAENTLQSQQDAAQSQRLSELEAENAALRARLERLEAALGERVAGER
jgi:hypothetical protein